MKRRAAGVERAVTNRARAARLALDELVDDDFLNEVDATTNIPSGGLVECDPNHPSHQPDEVRGPSNLLADPESESHLNDSICTVTSSIVLEDRPTRLSALFSDYESSESEESEVGDFVQQASLRKRLQTWYSEYGANLTQLQGLLEALRDDHPHLPKDARTVAQTPRSDAFIEKQLSNGTYIHLGLESALLLRLQSGLKKVTDVLLVDVNIDGLSKSDSSNLHGWPILGRCQDLVDDQPFTIGIFSGSGSPEPLNEFLKDYVDEVKRISRQGGILFEGKRYEVKIQRYILDTPARAHIKCIKGAKGTQSCERCLQEGETMDRYYYCYETEKSAPRTDEGFARMEYDEEHQNGRSPLLDLGANLVADVVLDPMHLFLGVTRRFLKFLMGVKQCKTGAKLTSDQISAISAAMLALRDFIPSEFDRKPRSLEFYSRWKATEARLFCLYIGIVVLKNNVEIEVYQLFLLYYVACRIVTSKSYCTNTTLLDYAEKLFCTFVKHSADKTVFGPSFVSINVHNLLHFLDDVRKHGSIDNWDAFPFENHLRILGGLIRSGAKVTKQIANRLAERDVCYMPPSAQESEVSPSGYDKFCKEYASLGNGAYTLSPNRKKDRYFFSNDTICCLKRIVKTSSGVCVVAHCADVTESYFDYPTGSQTVGVVKVPSWTRKNVEMTVDEVHGKVMFLPFAGENIAFKMLHTV